MHISIKSPLQHRIPAAYAYIPPFHKKKEKSSSSIDQFFALFVTFPPYLFPLWSTSLSLFCSGNQISISSRLYARRSRGKVTAKFALNHTVIQSLVRFVCSSPYSNLKYRADNRESEREREREREQDKRLSYNGDDNSIRYCRDNFPVKFNFRSHSGSAPRGTAHTYIYIYIP